MTDPIETDEVLTEIAGEVSEALTGVSQIVLYIASGNTVAAGKRALELAFDLVPPELLRQHLTAKGISIANEAADALDQAKFGQ